jgi:hypothetical protein
VPIYIPPELNPEGLPYEEWMKRAQAARLRAERADRQRERDLFRYARWTALAAVGALIVSVIALIVAFAH